MEGTVPPLGVRREAMADGSYGRGSNALGRSRVFGLPTQFFIRPDGTIASIGKTVDEAAAVAAIEAILP